MHYDFEAIPWLHPGEGGWVFLSLPSEYTQGITSIASEYKKGFGSVKVTARIGEIEWLTSLFPDKRSGSYVLPLKKAVRQRAHIRVGHPVRVVLSIEKLV